LPDDPLARGGARAARANSPLRRQAEDRAGVRWLQRLLDERTFSLIDVQVVAANLAALVTARGASAVEALRTFVR
jgi:hypothetical protein